MGGEEEQQEEKNKLIPDLNFPLLLFHTQRTL
jgi:hypothetical protein